MITKSYSAECYVENNNGEYSMECSLDSDSCSVFADYHGDNFTKGLNSILDSLEHQIVEQEEKNKKSPEDYIKELEDKIAALEAENHRLASVPLESVSTNSFGDNVKVIPIDMDELSNTLKKLYQNW